MAVCDYCGTTYRGGAAVYGKLRFCTHQCRDRGKVLEILDHVAPAIVDEEIERVPVSALSGMWGPDWFRYSQVASYLVGNDLYDMEDPNPLLLPVLRSQTPVEVNSIFWIAWMVDADRLFHYSFSNIAERQRHVASRRPSVGRSDEKCQD